MHLRNLIFAAIFFFGLPALAFSEEEEERPDVIVLSSGTTHLGDYFAVGGNVEISGVVTGDVYVLGSQVFIDGKVMGDVLVCAGNVEISGEVNNNVRALGGQVTISGKVGHNATVVAGNAALSPSAVIGGNIVCTVGNADMAATIGGEATVIASNLRVSNAIKSNLSAYVGQMRLTSKAFVGGNVIYTSNVNAWIDPQAKIGGTVTHTPSLVHEIIHAKWTHKLLVGSKVAALLMNFLYTFVVGWILLRLFTRNLENALSALKSHYWKSLTYGVVLLFLLPLASLILLMTILGAPFALTLIALNIIGFYTAKVYTILWASNALFSKIGLKPNKLPTFCLGLILYFILAAIPYIGFFVALAAMLFGLGAGVLAQRRKALFGN